MRNPTKAKLRPYVCKRGDCFTPGKGNGCKGDCKNIGPSKNIILRARVEVEISAIDPNATAEAIAELRRTLEKEGYTPSIDLRLKR